jgi:hypothetical protein
MEFPRFDVELKDVKLRFERDLVLAATTIELEDTAYGHMNCMYAPTLQRIGADPKEFPKTFSSVFDVRVAFMGWSVKEYETGVRDISSYAQYVQEKLLRCRFIENVYAKFWEEKTPKDEAWIDVTSFLDEQTFESLVQLAEAGGCKVR